MEKHDLSIASDIVSPQEELSALQLLLDSSLDVICSIDAEGRFVYVSSAAKQVWGYEPSEMGGKEYIKFVIAEDRPKTMAIATSIMEGATVTSFENRYLRKDGSIVPIIWSARWSAEKQTMYCVAKDATQSREAEKEKRLLNNRLIRAYQLAEIAWWEYNAVSKTYTCSDEIFTMYGWPKPKNNQATLRDFLSYVHPEDRPKLQQEMSQTGKYTYANYEHRVIKPKGEVIYVIHFIEVIRDENGLPVALHGTTKDITKRKLQQIKLEESKQQLQAYSQKLVTTLESIGDGFATFDREWTVTYWNRKAEELLHKKREEILGKNLWQEYKDALPLKFYSEYHRAVNENISVQFEEYFPPLNMWVDVAAYPSAEGLSVYFKDITTKKWQEEALRLASERFELAAKATSDALWDWDIRTHTCYFNDGFTALFGHDNKADLIYKNWMDNIHEEDKKQVMESLMGALNDTTTHQWQGNYRFHRKNSGIAYVLDRGYIIRDREGKAIRMVGSMQDITKLKETEEEMQKLSLVAKATVNVVVITDAEERITWVNKAFTDITEYSFEEAVGRKPGELLQGPNTSEKTKRYLRKCVEKRRPFNCEIINYSKSGREYWMEVKGQPIFDEKGALKHFFAIQTDITARKEVETIVRLSEEKYKRLFYDSPLPKWIFNAETLQVVDVNDAATHLYGYSKEEFIRLTMQDLRLPEDELEMYTAVQTLMRQPNAHFHRVVRHRKKSGETFYIEISSFTIELKSGLHFMVSGMDMTEKLQLQQQVIAEKVGAQKQIARAIIHTQETERSEIGKELHDNVCQLLTTSKLYFENIRYMPEQQEAFTKKGIDLLIQSINEIRYLSRQLVSPVLNDIGFESAINELLTHYRSLDVFDIQFSYDVNIELADKDLKTSIIRILQEQFNNTVKYAKASSVEVCISDKDDCLLLHYADNGVGFDPAKAKKGIGLSNIKNRVSAYRGKVDLTTAPGKGYSMRIAFPLTEKAESTHANNLVEQ